PFGPAQLQCRPAPGGCVRAVQLEVRPGPQPDPGRTPRRLRLAPAAGADPHDLLGLGAATVTPSPSPSISTARAVHRRTGDAVARRRLSGLRRRLDDAGRNDLGFPNAVDLDLAPLGDVSRRLLNNVGYPGCPTSGFRAHTLDEEYEVVQR